MGIKHEKKVKNQKIWLDLRQRLFELQDENYAQFTKKLTPNATKVIGVRLFELRKIAKEVAHSDFRDYLQNASTEYHEECMIYGLVIGYIDVDIEERIQLFDGFMGKISNWGICDSCTMNVKAFDSSEKAFDYFVQKLKGETREYAVRAIIVALFSFFYLEKYIDRVLELLTSVKSDSYYINMAIAWAIATLLYKNFDKTITVLQRKMLSTFVHKKSIQKAMESFRLTTDQKKIIKQYANI